MRAMVLDSPGKPLREIQLPDPKPAEGQVLVQVRVCAVCRTDLHVVDGELPAPKLPLIPGHEIIGKVVQKGKNVDRFEIGDRVGIPWMDGVAANVHIAWPGKKTSVIAPVSRDTLLMEDMLNTRLQIRAFAFRFRIFIPMQKPRL